MDVPAPMQIALMALVSAGQDTSKLEPSVKQVNCFMQLLNVVRYYNSSDHVSVTAYYIEKPPYKYIVCLSFFSISLVIFS